MPYPPAQDRANKTDPNADAAAREQETLKSHVAASNPGNNPGPNRYGKYVDAVVQGVKDQIKRQRGAAQSRK